MEEKVIIEYSISQKSFHRTTITEMIAKNLGQLICRIQTDYLPIMVFDNNDNCDKWLKINGDKLKDYSMYESFTGELVVI